MGHKHMWDWFLYYQTAFVTVRRPKGGIVFGRLIQVVWCISILFLFVIVVGLYIYLIVYLSSVDSMFLVINNYIQVFLWG